MTDRPQRIQLRRTRGWRKPPGCINVARPSRYGNPYRVGDLIRDPVNWHNPVAQVLDEASTEEPGVYERKSFDGVPYTVTVRRVVDRADAVALFRRWVVFEGFDLSPLAGHDLGCWCPLDGLPCHASDVLLPLANGWDLPETP